MCVRRALFQPLNDRPHVEAHVIQVGGSLAARLHRLADLLPRLSDLDLPQQHGVRVAPPAGGNEALMALLEKMRS